MLQNIQDDGIDEDYGVDWDTIWVIQRDISSLYRELSEHIYISGDLAFSLLYKLPYWKYLNCRLPQAPVPSMLPDDEAFMHIGCLVFIYTMAWEIVDGCGFYLLPNLDAAYEAVREYEKRQITHYQKPTRLASAVLAVLEAVKSEQKSSRAIEDEAVWVYETYVYGYFSSVAEHCKTKLLQYEKK